MKKEPLIMRNNELIINSYRKEYIRTTRVYPNHFNSERKLDSYALSSPKKRVHEYWPEGD